MKDIETLATEYANSRWGGPASTWWHVCRSAYLDGIKQGSKELAESLNYKKAFEEAVNCGLDNAAVVDCIKALVREWIAAGENGHCLPVIRDRLLNRIMERVKGERHLYKPFTTRDGSQACSQCDAPKEHECHS